MVSNKEFVSRVTNGGKFLSKDTHISGRYILSIGRVKSKFFLSQKLDELSLTREEGIKTSIECFPMKRIKSRDCGIVAFKLCESIMKSCNKLPEGIYGKVGSGIISVSSIDGRARYDFTTPTQWARDAEREDEYKIGPNRKFYIKDGYILTPGSKNELLDIVMITTDKFAAAKLSGCGTSSSTDSDTCGAWDSDFVCPDRFLDLVIKDTISEVANFYRTSQPDENPNMDEHQKTKTIN